MAPERSGGHIPLHLPLELLLRHTSCLASASQDPDSWTEDSVMQGLGCGLRRGSWGRGSPEGRGAGRDRGRCGEVWPEPQLIPWGLWGCNGPSESSPVEAERQSIVAGSRRAGCDPGRGSSLQLRMTPGAGLSGNCPQSVPGCSWKGGDWRQPFALYHEFTLAGRAPLEFWLASSQGASQRRLVG